jgi:hypothetical protein
MSDFNPQPDGAEPTRALVAADLEKLLDRPIAYHRIFAQIGGGPLEGIFLSQAIYWTQRTKNPDKWFYKTQADWFLETNLTRRHQETARRNLRTSGILKEELRGIPAQLFFRIDLDQVQKLICNLLDGKQSVQTSVAESAIQGRRKAPDKKGVLRPAIQSETTSENSSENSSSTDDDEFLNSLLERAVEHGALRKRAATVIAANPTEAARQLEYFPHRENLKNPGAALLSSIEQSWPEPPAHTAAQSEARGRASRARSLAQEKETKAAAHAEERRKEAENKMLDVEFKALPKAEQDEIIDQAKRRCAPLAALGVVPMAALQAARRNIQRAEMGLPIED